MESHHHINFENAARMAAIPDHSIDLVVTSPAYPMIQMWDDLFTQMDGRIAKFLSDGAADNAFERMHLQLDPVWAELGRVVKPGGVVCINIGDAVRTVAGNFRLFANHVRVCQAFQGLDFTQLPSILWRKTTNAPNKFMGSGMLPPSAYVTLEHEHILIFRRRGKRLFATPEEKKRRRESAFFWEERNEWFSDIWFNLVGIPQRLNNGGPRERSAAFPLEIPYRLIQMFSLKGDTVLDPFLGTGTTLLAAMASARHCAGIELDADLQNVVLQRSAALPEAANQLILKRLQSHAEFVRKRLEAGEEFKHFNRPYKVPVITRQETDLFLNPVKNVQFVGNQRFRVIYADDPATDLQEKPQAAAEPRREGKARQLQLF